MRDVWSHLDDVAKAIPAHHWMLIGGLMVHAHAQQRGIRHVRPTDDADLVIELSATSYPAAASAIEARGFTLHTPIDRAAPVHRFTKNGAHVDLMAAEGTSVRYVGRDVVIAPGSRSALRRTIVWHTPSGAPVRIPDLSSALSLKGAAYGVPGANRVRHLQDAVTLFACADDDLDLSKSMRTHVNALVRGLEHVDAWGLADPTTRRLAVRAIKSVRPDWEIPAFIRRRRA